MRVDPLSDLRRISDIFVFDMETGNVLVNYWHWWKGPIVGEMKKGRGGEQQVAQSQQALAATETPEQQAQYNAINTGLTALTPTSSTALSPAVQAQYDADMANVRNTYGNLAQSGFRTLAARGFGSAPTGAASSLNNTMLSQEGQGETAAYRNAQINNTNQGFKALQARQGLMNSVNPNVPLSGAGTSYANLNKMGSTIGDIGAGIEGAAGAVGSLGKAGLQI